MPEENNLTLFENKKTEAAFADVFSRMDDDEEIYFLEPYELVGYDGKTKVKDVDNVTSNDPLVYAVAVQGILAAAQRQTIVEGRDLPKGENKANKVEDFLDDVFAMANEVLVENMDYTIDTFINEQIVIRGRCAARALVGMEGDRWIPYIDPIDTRNFVYEKGRRGMIWGGYETRRAKSAIEEEYGVTIEGKDALVVDFWNKEKNEIYIASKLESTQPNTFEQCPFAIALSNMGSLLTSEDAQKHRGESVFWQNRDLYPEYNKSLTIYQSLSMETFRPPIAAYSEDGTMLPGVSPYGSRKVTALKFGEKLEELYPREDIKQAGRLFYSALTAMLQRGSLPQVDYGNLQFPLSAVAISSLSESKDRTIILLVNALATWRLRLSRIIINQFILGGVEAEIGEAGLKRLYQPADLEGDFKISYMYTSISPEQNIANYSVAQAAGRMISDDTKRRDVIRMKDPDGEQRKIDMQDAKLLTPALGALDAAEAFIEEGDDLRAHFVMEALGINIDQLKGGKVGDGGNGKEPAGGEDGKPLVPLIGSRGAGGTGRQSSNKTASQMQSAEGVEEGG